ATGTRHHAERRICHETFGSRVRAQLNTCTVTKNYRYMRCAAFGLGLGATKEHSRQRSVTEEQQRPRPNAAQPSGRQSFFALTALLAPHRPLTGMLGASAEAPRALSARKIPCRAYVDNSLSQYLPGAARSSRAEHPPTALKKRWR